MMKKRAFACTIVLIGLIMGLCACSKNPSVGDSALLELPGIKWGATPEEVKEVLNLTDEQIIDESLYGGSYWRIYVTDVRFFGEKVSFGQFTFRPRMESGEYSLSSVELYYPDDTDMNIVNDALVEIYGSPKDEALGFTRYKVENGTVRSYDDPGPNLDRSQQTRMINWWESTAKRADVLTADIQELMISTGYLTYSGIRTIDPEDPSSRDLALEYLANDSAVFLCCTDSARVDAGNQYYTKNLVTFDASEYIWALVYYGK